MKTNSTELLIIKALESHGIAVCLKPDCPKVISPSLVDRIRKFQDSLANDYFTSPWDDNLYVIWYCHRHQAACKLGFDFNFINYALREHKECKLEMYIKKLIDVLFLNYISLGLPLVNCSMIDKKISGIFLEFFYLNEINFVKLSDEKIESNMIMQVDILELSNNLSLSKEFYDKNIYYKCNYFDFKSMKSILEKTKKKAIDEKKIIDIRAVFDGLYQSTLASIYNMASKNPALLKRLAQMQT